MSEKFRGQGVWWFDGALKSLTGAQPLSNPVDRLTAFDSNTVFAMRRLTISDNDIARVIDDNRRNIGLR